MFQFDFIRLIVVAHALGYVSIGLFSVIGIFLVALVLVGLFFLTLRCVRRYHERKRNDPKFQILDENVHNFSFQRVLIRNLTNRGSDYKIVGPYSGKIDDLKMDHVMVHFRAYVRLEKVSTKNPIRFFQNLRGLRTSTGVLDKKLDDALKAAFSKAPSLGVLAEINNYLKSDSYLDQGVAYRDLKVLDYELYENIGGTLTKIGEKDI